MQFVCPPPFFSTGFLHAVAGEQKILFAYYVTLYNNSIHTTDGIKVMDGLAFLINQKVYKMSFKSEHKDGRVKKSIYII